MLPDSMAKRSGPSTRCRLVPRSVANTPQVQALLKDLANALAAKSEGDGNSEEDIVAANA